ncbi:MAG: hypothetical protein IM600_08515 [Bacteroidetes bacterium]|jgi:hypothetical protein|nr:hypothetical protein [Bacteroidota bacterium]MCA6443455.1 hypothetical protein [Bacteroidota bacterium]
MFLFQIFIIFIFVVFVLFKNYFIPKKQKGVLSNSLVIISSFLLVGILSGYVTYKTSDSMQVNLEDLPPEEVVSVNVRRAVCVSAFVVCLVSFGYAFVSMYDYSIASEVSQTVPVVQQTVPVVQQTVPVVQQTVPVVQQTVPVFSTVSTQLASTLTPEVLATKLGITKQAFFENLGQALKAHDNVDKLSSLFDVFYCNSSNDKFNRAAPYMSAEVRAGLVRALVRISRHPELTESILTNAKIYSDYLLSNSTLPKPEPKFAFHYYIALALDLIKK